MWVSYCPCRKGWAGRRVGVWVHFICRSSAEIPGLWGWIGTRGRSVMYLHCRWSVGIGFRATITITIDIPSELLPLATVFTPAFFLSLRRYLVSFLGQLQHRS